jgi:phage terminase small subunit
MLQEVALLAYADLRKMFRPDGALIPIHELPDDVAATVASLSGRHGRRESGAR